MAKGRIEQEIVVKVVGGKDVADLDKQIKDLIKQKAKVVVDVDADAAAAKKKLDAIDQQVADLEKQKAEIEVTADTGDADKKIDEIDKQLADLKGQKAELEVRVEADTDEADRKLADLDTQLSDLRGEKAELVVEAKVTQALDALGEVAEEAKRAEVAAEALGLALGPELTARSQPRQHRLRFPQHGFVDGRHRRSRRPARCQAARHRHDRSWRFDRQRVPSGQGFCR